MEAEIFCSLNSVSGNPYPSSRIDSLWNDSLTLHFHDGLFVADQDLLELIDLGRHVSHTCQKLRNRATRELGQRIAADPNKQAVGLFNPLSWERRETVEIQAVFATTGTRRLRLKDSEDRVIPHQLLKVRHMGRAARYYKESWLLADVTVPPLGHRVLYLEPVVGREEVAALESAVTILENRHIRLRLGTGGIESLEDKLRGVGYQGAGNPIYLSTSERWFYHGGPIAGQEQVTDARWRLLEQGPLRSRARMEGRLGRHGVEMEVALYHTLDRVDFDLTLNSDGGSGFFVTQVRFGDPGSLHTGIPFGAERRDLSAEPFGKGGGVERQRKDVFFGHHWVDFSDGEKGLTMLAAEGKRGFWFDPESRTLGNILLMTVTPHQVGAEALYTPESPSRIREETAEMEQRFSHRYFRGTGSHNFSYSLLPHGGDWRAVGSHQRGQEKLFPLRWSPVHPHAEASTPLDHSFLRLSPESVAVSSWQWRTNAYQLRVYEGKGQEGMVEIRLPFEPGYCEAVDLNGRPSDSTRVELDRDRIRFPIRPWEIVTFEFSKEKKIG